MTVLQGGLFSRVGLAKSKACTTVLLLMKDVN